MTLFDHRGLRVNISRMKKNILDLASIGATPHGGVTRLALSNEDKIARQTLVSWMKETGLEVIVDQMGNSARALPISLPAASIIVFPIISEILISLTVVR